MAFRLNLGVLQVTIGADTAPLDAADKRIRKTTKSMGRSFLGLGRIIGAVLSVEAVRRTVLLADKMNMLDQQIKNVVKNAASFKKIRDGIRSIAAETGASIESVTRLTQALIIAGESIGATDDQVIEMTSNLNKLGIIGGASADAMKNSMRQFGQAMAGGVVRAEEFNSIIENTPLIAKAIADGMGLTTGELRKMVIEGKVLSEEVFRSLQTRTESINEKFAAMPLTVDRASGMMANSFATAIQELDNGFLATEDIAAGIKKVADIIGTDLVPFIDNMVDGFIEFVDLLDMSTAATQDLANDTFDLAKSWDLVTDFTGRFIQVLQNFPAILRNVTTIMLGEWDKLWSKTATSFNLFTALISSGLENAFLGVIPRIQAIFNDMLSSVANDFSKLIKLFGTGFTDEIAQSLENVSNDFSAASQAITDNEIEQQQIRTDLYLAEVEEINAKHEAHVIAVDGIILAGIKDTEALQVQSRERTKIRQRERKDRRTEGKEVAAEAEKITNVLKKTNAEKIKDMQAFSTASNTLAAAGIISDKANAAIQVGISAAVAVAKTGELGFPLALPFIATALANIANARQLLSGAGRQFGGTATGGMPIPINEGGPEMFTNNSGRQFLLPDKSGTITPLKGGGSGGGSGVNIIINNNAPGVEVTRTMSDETIMLAIEMAEQNAVSTVNASLGSGRGETAESLRTGFSQSRNI